MAHNTGRIDSADRPRIADQPGPLVNDATPSFTRRLYTIRQVQPSRAANSGSVIVPKRASSAGVHSATAWTGRACGSSRCRASTAACGSSSCSASAAWPISDRAWCRAGRPLRASTAPASRTVRGETRASWPAIPSSAQRPCAAGAAVRPPWATQAFHGGRHRSWQM
jgi:hypothetical protein